MILWTIQPEIIFKDLMNSGVYHCDFRQSMMYDCKLHYDWLVAQMEKRIGSPPKGVEYPVWAWHTWSKDRKKPDLRNERWGNGWKGERFFRMEIEIPDHEIVLSDFDAWSIILLNGLLAETEEENDRLEILYEALSPDEQLKMKSINWEGAFDLTPKKNEWMTRGECIQATFWELKKDQIRKVTPFVSASPKPDYIDENGEFIPEKLPKRRNNRQP